MTPGGPPFRPALAKGEDSEKIPPLCLGTCGATSTAVSFITSLSRATTPPRIWQRRYYDFNLWSQAEFAEELRYIHGNPVRRGLAEQPEDWPWSSFPHYVTGVEGTVEIESQWTARKRERLGIVPQLRRRGQN